MKTKILIHGSWHGAWNWHRLIPILEKQGHRAYAVDLPGKGQDKTPVELVTMENSVKKICDLIDSIEEKVILVGHSKNGIMISQAAELRPDRIEKLIYLAAYLVPNGKTMREYSMQDTEGVLKPYVTMHDSIQATTLGKEIYREGLYHDCDENIIQLANVLLTTEPVSTAITPLQLTDKNFGRVPKVYIECTQDRAVTPYMQRRMYTELPCNKVYTMEASHSPFFSMPQELADILCQ
jgi:pimeloyl-ACP methyl ester carboxylesterase